VRWKLAGAAPATDAGHHDPVASLTLIAVAVHLALPWVLGHLPYQDMANHVARYTLMDRVWSGVGPPWIRVGLVWSPYIAVDLFGAALVHLFGPHLAVRVMTTVAIGLPPLGMYRLLRAAASHARRWTLVAVLLSCSPFLIKGLLNYQIGIGGALLWLAAWWPRRERPSLGAAACLVLGMGLLFLIHPYAGSFALLVVGVEALLSVTADLRSHAGSIWRRQLGRLSIGAASGAVAIVLLWQMQHLGAGDVAATIAMRSPLSKLAELTEPFYTFTPWEMVVTVVAYGIAVAAAWQRRSPDASSRVFGFATGALALLYLLTPERVGGASHLDVRWLIPGLLLIFVAAEEPAEHRVVSATRALFVACLMHAGIILYFGHRIDHDLDDFDAVRRQLPPGARVLAVVGGPHRYGRVEPYLHYALWQTTETGARVGGLFSYVVAPIGKPPIVSPQFAHFRELDPPVALFDPWRNAGSPELPWPVVTQQYDYILQAGVDADLTSMISVGACEEQRQEAITLYHVGACRARESP